MFTLRGIVPVITAVCSLFATATRLSAAEPKKVTSVEGMTEYKLDNGTRILLFPDASKPNVTVNMTVFVGSRHEGYGEGGMAHLLEHMVFKGTPDHPQVPKVLQSHGARFNGTTWVDRTNYFETLPASDENLEFAIKLEADRLVNSFIKGEDLASEMTVVRNEFEQGENSPESVLEERMLAAAYEWHNYGKTTIGNRADIERVPVDSLREFYRKYYQPDNLLVIVAGMFDEAKALGYLQKYFGSLKRPERKLNNTYTEEPAQDGERIVTLRRVGNVAVVGAVYHIPAGSHEDYVAVDVLESILTSAPSGRLYKTLVETKKASNVSGSAYAWHDPSVLKLSATVTQGNEPQVVLDTMLDTIEEVVAKGVTKEEVDRARQNLFKQRELVANDTSKLAVQLTEWEAMGDWRLYFLYRDRLEAVKLDDVNRVAKTFLKQSNRTVGLYIPTKEPTRSKVPPTPDLAQTFKDYKGRETVALGEAFDATPQNIESRTKRLDLASGVKAALLPKKTRGEVVHLRLTLRYGDEKNLRGLAKACEFLPALMTRGTKQLTRQQLQDELDKYRARLTGSGTAGDMTFSIQTQRAHLPAVLDLLKQVLREPSLPESELDVLKQNELSQLAESLADPRGLAFRFVQRALNAYPSEDPRYTPTLEEESAQTKEVTVAVLRDLYTNYIGATSGECVVVGDFDEEATKKQLMDILSNWKTTQSYSRLTRTAEMRKPGVSETILTPDKANAIYFAGQAVALRDSDPDYPALIMGDYILGGGSLSSRLGDRVRQKEGLSYGVGSNFRASSLDDRATFSFFAIYNPGVVEKLKATIKEEIDKFLKSGVTEQELETARKGYLQSRAVARADDSQLAQMLESTVYAGRTMLWYADVEGRISKLTPDEVANTFRKRFDPKKLVIVTAGDFKSDAAAK